MDVYNVIILDTVFYARVLDSLNDMGYTYTPLNISDFFLHFTLEALRIMVEQAISEAK